MRHFPRAVLASVAFLLLAFFASLAFGGEVVTTKPALIEAREADGRVVVVDGKPLRFALADECLAYWKAQLRARGVPSLDFQCVPGAIKGNVTGTCEDPPPDFVPELLEPTACPPPNEFRYQILETEQTRQDYPRCWTVTKKIVASCDPPAPIAYEHDDPADPPLELMAHYPVVAPGTPVDFEGVLPPLESPDAAP